MADYVAEESKKKVGEKVFTVVNLTPRFSEAEKRQKKTEIEQKLYDIFGKYMEQSH